MYSFVLYSQSLNMCVVCSQGHCVLEMPSGTGKTVTLLSLIIAYLRVSFVYTSCDMHVTMSACDMHHL